MQAFKFVPVRKLAALAAVALDATVAGTSVASAGTSVVNFTSNTNIRGLGSFSGTAALDTSTDLLTVVMNNSSSRGHLYGLAFDLESGEKGKDVTNDGKHGFKNVGKHGVTVKPYGKYEAGAFDSGSNKHAIAAGTSKTFVFQITGALSGLTAFDLLDNPQGESVVATFKGFKHGKKDHAGAAVVIPTTPADINADTPSGMGGIVLPLAIGPAGPTGSTSTGGQSTGGTFNLPGGGGQTTMAVPLPSAAVSGMTMLALLAAVAAKRKLAGIL